MSLRPTASQAIPTDPSASLLPCTRTPLIPVYSFSQSRINMCATDEIVAVQASLSYPRSRAHGSLMLFAWLVLSPIASYIARYCKPSLVPPCWFPLHAGTWAMVM